MSATIAAARDAAECAVMYARNLGAATAVARVTPALNALCAVYEAELARVTAERDAARAALERANLSARFVDRRARQYGRPLYLDLPEEKRGAIDALERYGSLLCEMRFAPGVPKLRVIAAEMGVDVADFRAVEDNEAAPFDDAITRKACVACGRDPQPMLDAAAAIREMLREPEKT